MQYMYFTKIERSHAHTLAHGVALVCKRPRVKMTQAEAHMQLNSGLCRLHKLCMVVEVTLGMGMHEMALVHDEEVASSCTLMVTADSGKPCCYAWFMCHIYDIS